MPLNHEDFDALDRLSEGFHENARAKGFTTLHDRLVALSERTRQEGDAELADYLLLVEQGNELMLIVTELGEAHESIRTSPYPSDVTYYVDDEGNPTLVGVNDDGTPRKPEGLGSELADVQIRLGDTVGRRGISLGVETRGKAVYNATRAQRHGGKKF